MLSQMSEITLHRVRWVLTCGWLLLIFSLFYDPISPLLANPNHTWSPFRFNPNACIQVQGVCLENYPFRIGPTLFWGLIVPCSIFLLLIFGHELWRRICPLSFLSQIPVALKWQRQKQRVDAKTGKTRSEIVKIKKESWLGQNYLYVQLGWLYIGLCARILFIDSDRMALALWILFTIGAAITVGYLYGGKSWCQYFCPMAPVQKVYGEPGGLLTSRAHMDDRSITQSMCRTVTPDGKEQSACVACKSPCIDIDSERSYWDGLMQPDQKFLYYGYIGLVVGYFLYYYLYAGNWDYYFSGAWTRQPNPLTTVLSPGFYLFGNPIPIPKLIAAPLTLATFSGLGLWVGKTLENRYKAHLRRIQKRLSPEQIRHRVFTVGTFLVFNFFFIFGGRPLILLLPSALQYVYDVALVSLSTLWLYRTWRRNPELYSRESLASRFRKQLGKLQLNISRFMDGRTLEDLNTHEVYVLAKVLPGFTKEKRHEAYKGVLREALAEAYVDTASSLEVLRQMRSELDISDDEHQQILEELGVEDPELLNPHHLRSREDLVHLTGYRRALERMLQLQQRQGDPGSSDSLPGNPDAIRKLRQEYSITFEEEAETLTELNPQALTLRRLESLIDKIWELIERFRVLNQPILHDQEAALVLLRTTVERKKRLVVTALLEGLEQLGELEAALPIARTLGELCPTVLQDALQNPEERWQKRLPPQIWTLLTQPATIPFCSLDMESGTIAHHLEALLQESNPLLQAISLHILYQLDPAQGRYWASRLPPSASPLLREVADTICSQSETKTCLSAFKTLEKLVYLSNSDFFSGLNSTLLLDLADRAVIKVYGQGAVVTEEGDTCRELLLLLEGSAQSTLHREDGSSFTRHLIPGQILDELEVLCHGPQTGTIVAETDQTRILAIPVDTLDDLADRDTDFARRLLDLESQRLQQLLYRNQITAGSVG